MNFQKYFELPLAEWLCGLWLNKELLYELRIQALADVHNIRCEMVSTLWIELSSIFTNIHRFQDTEEMKSCVPAEWQKPKVIFLASDVKS